MHARLSLGVVTALLMAPIAPLARAEPVPVATLHDPEKPGPYPVGVTTLVLHDAARQRSLKTEVWYPAEEASRSLPRNRFTDYLDRGTNARPAALAGLALKTSPAELDKRFRNLAARDARIAEGRFAVLLFSHGNGGTRTQSIFWCEHMASHGFVVCAPDHTGNALATTLGGRIVLADRSPQGVEASSTARPLDLRFLLDALERLDKGDDSRFAGRLDLERVGLAGHSMGAGSILRAADVDLRVRAVSPWASASPVTRTGLPVLLLLAAEDVALTAKGISWCRTWFDALSGPAHLLELRNAGHNSFTELFQLDPSRGDGVGSGVRVTDGTMITYLAEEPAHRLINGMTLAFFDRYVREEAGREAYLLTNPLPAEAIVRTQPPPPR